MASRSSLTLMGCFAAVLWLGACAPKAPTEVERGRYLVSVMGCGDCHTPGGFSPKPDIAHALSGSDAEFNLPGVGAFTPPNLTPDRATGLGNWSREQIAAAITTGVRPDGRVLAPAMPWQGFSHLTRADALAIAAYLQSLPAVSNKVPGPGPAKPERPGMVEAISARAK